MTVACRNWLALAVVVAVVASGGCLSVDGTPGGGDDVPSVTHTPDDLADVSYVAANDTVKIPFVRHGEDVASYRWISFEAFANVSCVNGALDLVRERVDARLDEPVGTGQSGDAVSVTYVPERGVTGAAVEAALPGAVEVTVHAFERRHTCTVPVTVEEAEPVEPLALAG